MKEKKVDPILVSVFQKRLISICLQMGLTMKRTTQSPIFNQAMDAAVGIYDIKGDMLAQYQYIPCVSGGLRPETKVLIDYFGDEIYDGDVFMHSDVYSGGNQAADWGMFKPVFYDGELVAWSCCKGHMADSGGAYPGGYNPPAMEVWAENLRLMPIKVIERGKRRRDVWDFIFANVRFPVVEADAYAMVGTCEIGARGVRALIDHYGIDTFKEYSGHIMDATEREVRAAIEAIPDGTYYGEAPVYVGGDFDKRMIRVNMKIEGGDITFDYTGTDPQCDYNFSNVPFMESMTISLIGLVNLTNPYIPWNEGLLRPVHVIAPEGCILHPTYPHACGLGNHIIDSCHDAIMMAMAPILPDKVSAPWGQMNVVGVAFFDPRRNAGRFDILFEGACGPGAGAVKGKDGHGYTCSQGCCGGYWPDSEMFELVDPHLILTHDWAQDSGGAGQWKGGYGTYTVHILKGGDNRGANFGGSYHEGDYPRGLFGGKEGTKNQYWVELPDGTRRDLQQLDVWTVPEGTELHLITAGGGGYGPSYLRPIEKVLEDVEDEMVSIKKAREEYGVVIEQIDPMTFKVDYEQTEKLRKEMKEKAEREVAKK